ncbi:MAG: DNRLRE domain-containing protein [Opitutaceae bacterium]|nr:DNRLRE domain-containing protein [Opitutaceae bacterium]
MRASSQAESVVPDVFTLGETALVLFFHDTASKKLSVWVNPVIAGSLDEFASVAPTFSSGDAPLDLLGSSGQLSTIGVMLASRVASATTSNRLDSLRLSSGVDGYYHVTGMSVPPVILAQPAAKTIVDRGAPATLTVSATGVGPLLYQWTLWDAPIPGATGSSLAIPSVQAENQGKYRVIVANDGGAASVTSDLAVVLIRENLVPLAITQQPALSPATVVDGTPVLLSVAVAGTPPFEYQWRKNGEPIPGATDAAFSIPVSRVADSGDYDVEITDLAREKVTSAAVPLRVQVPPSITTQPQNAVSYAGGPASFMVEARGTDIAYQWKRNGAAIPAPAGTAGATLLLTNLAAADNGAAYTVVVANGVGSVESLPVTLALEGGTPPAAAGSVSAAADATVANGASAALNLDGGGLAVSAFGAADGARKAYLAFDLPLAVESTDASAASLALTLGGEPFVNGGTGATHPKNPVRIRLHGIINNTDTWAENAVTWNTAPAGANSATAPGAGTVPLAETTVDVATRFAGDAVVFDDPRIAQFLNWAAGRRGNLYGNGAASDTDHKVTFVITSIDEGANFAGVRFADKEAGAASAPALAFDTAPVGPDLASGRADASPAEPGATQGRALQNERYTVTLADDLGVDVTDKTTGATAHFAAAFEVLHNTADPSLSYATTGVTPQISMPSWKTDIPGLATAPGDRAHDYGAARGARVPLLPAFATINDGRILWRFTPSDAAVAGFQASLELPSGSAAPRLRWTLAPSGERHYAVSFTGLPGVPNEEIDAFYMPGIWDGRRFPAKQYVIDEIRATTPAVLRKITGQPVVAGAAVDPFEIPVRVSTSGAAGNGLFGLYTNDFTATQNLPAIAAPLYGGAGSRTDGTLSFSVRLVVNGGTLDAAIRDVITGIYGFRDYRRNLAGGSLNTAIDNLVDYLLDETVDPRDGVAKGYSYWRPNEKANEYVNDDPTVVRFQSAATALGLALVRDDAVYYEKRALPSIEYFVSRPSDTMVFTGSNAGEPLGGPVSGYYSTDFFSLLALTGGRTSAYATLADQSWAKSFTASSETLLEVVPASPDRAQTFNLSFRAWHSLIAGYKATGDDGYLAGARVLADAYIKHRYTDGPASDFTDVANSFWNQIGGRWESLLEMSELTGDAAYAGHAARAMDEFIRHIQFGPALNDFSVDGGGAATPAVKSALVSEVGLTSEASATSNSHRGIFMSAYASPSLMRIAGLSADPFYAAVGRSGIIGRWLNYPGYTIRNHYRAGQLAPEWPLRWYGVDPDYSGGAVTAHMNHPASLASIAIDFLMADAEYKSAGAVKFPWQFSDSKGYFRGRVFGGAPGQFYGESGVWPWLPRGLVSLSGENAVQLNYVAGHGNGRLYLAFSNQSATEVTAAVTIRADKAQFAPGARMRVWRDNVPQAHGVFANGASTVTVPPGGFTAVVIDDAAPVLGLQADYQNGNGAALPAESFSQRNDPGIGQVTGVVLSLSPSRQSAYVYVSSGTDTLQAATLTYSIDGGPDQTQAKAAFPFEFSVPLPDGAQYFTYSVTGAPAGGGAAVVGMTDTLFLAAQPLITRHPQTQTRTAGGAVLLTVEADDAGGQYSYQWFKNNAPIPGETSPSLGFLCAMADDQAEYYAVVTRGLIDVVSNPAVLTVLPVPDVAITTQPAGVTQAAGTAHTLAVGAQDATGYQWFKDGQAIPGAVSSSLALAGADYEGGVYHVVVYGLVSGAPGSVASNPAAVAFTPVLGVPFITAQPQGRAVVTGVPFTLSVAATGAASYQWYHDDIAIPGATSSVLGLSGAWTDNGGYHVVVSNGAGGSVSQRAVVTILPEPVGITGQPVGGAVPHGSPLTLTVAVSGEAEFQWRKDGVPIPGATSPALALAGGPADAGVYDVVITTPVGGITSAPATVTITPAPDSHFAQSSGIVMDASGVLYVADSGRHVIQAVAANKNVTVLAGALDSPGAVDGRGVAAKFNTPAGLAARSGTLFVADSGNNSIRAVALSTAVVSTLVPGNISDAALRLSQPSAIATDSAGNVYVADTGNHVIRKVSPSGEITTLAGAPGISGTANASGTLARFNAPAGIALRETGGGTLYVADTGNHTLRAIALGSGAVSTIAGRPAVAGCDDGPAAAALLNAPSGLVLSGADLYFVDTDNSLVRKLAGGAVTTVAGYPGIGALPGVPGFKDGAGSGAWFNYPEAIALGSNGTLYVADTGNKAIRSMDPSGNVATLSVTATASGTSQPPPGGDTGTSGGGGGGGAPSLYALALLALLPLLRRCRAK